MYENFSVSIVVVMGDVTMFSNIILALSLSLLRNDPARMVTNPSVLGMSVKVIFPSYDVVPTQMHVFASVQLESVMFSHVLLAVFMFLLAQLPSFPPEPNAQSNLST